MIAALVIFCIIIFCIVYFCVEGKDKKEKDPESSKLFRLTRRPDIKYFTKRDGSAIYFPRLNRAYIGKRRGGIYLTDNLNAPYICSFNTEKEARDFLRLLENTWIIGQKLDETSTYIESGTLKF